jgi:hypothetical protein
VALVQRQVFQVVLLRLTVASLSQLAMVATFSLEAVRALLPPAQATEERQT